MKFVRLISLLIIGAAFYQSCSSDFNPNALYKNITVVYGLLSVTDTVHYIKIEKAYLTQTGNNAYTSAQIADSIYYPQEAINAQLEAINNGALVNTIPLRDTVLPPKQPGAFATTPNVAYYTRAALNPAYAYKIVITNNKTGLVTTAQTNLVDTFTVTYPSLGPPKQPIVINPAANYSYTTYWENSPNAAVYQVVIRFHYKEISATDSTIKILMWTLPQFVNTGGNSQSTSFPEKTFYTLVASSIAANPAIKRRAVSFDFWYYGGAQDFYNYQQINLANSTGLVQGQVNPSYTDVTNGIGLFSSTVFEQLNGFSVEGKTMDSLACEPVTRALNFYDEFGELCGQ